MSLASAHAPLARACALAATFLCFLVGACSTTGLNDDVRDGGNLVRDGSNLDGGPGSDGTTPDGGIDAAQTCVPDASHTSDPANCGACGHDCLGGACVGGRCQAVDVVYVAPDGGPGPKVPTGAIGCLEDGILWPDQGHMEQNYADGAIYELANTSTTSVSLTPFPMNGWGVATDGTDFFFLNGGTYANGNWLLNGDLVQCPLAGCSSNPLVLAAASPADGGLTIGGGDPKRYGIGLAGSSVYWSPGEVAEVDETPIGGGAITQGGVAGLFTYFAATATDAYWADAHDYYGVFRAPLAGGAPVRIPALAGSPVAGLVVDSQSLYLVWQNSGTGGQSTIQSCPAPDCAGGLHTLLTTNTPPDTTQGLGQDSTSLFWTETSAAGVSLRTCAKANCKPTTVASTQVPADQICVTDKAITWTSATGIGRLAR